MTHTLLPAVIHRECLELDRLVETCLKRYERRSEFARTNSEDILADSLAACLHSFYGSIERVFEAIVRQIDGAASRGAEWHRELLQAVSVPRAGMRPQIISEESYRTLEPYRSFRHVFRHLYSHHIDPGRIFTLTEGLAGDCMRVRTDLMQFADIVERLSE